MRKISKILRTVSEKTGLPTNQPTNQLLPTTPILYDLANANPKNVANYLLVCNLQKSGL